MRCRSRFIAPRIDRKTCGRYLIKIPFDRCAAMLWCSAHQRSSSTVGAYSVIYRCLGTHPIRIESPCFDCFFFSNFFLFSSFTQKRAVQGDCHFRDSRFIPTRFFNRQRKTSERARDYRCWLCCCCFFLSKTETEKMKITS